MGHNILFCNADTRKPCQKYVISGFRFYLRYRHNILFGRRRQNEKKCFQTAFSVYLFKKHIPPLPVNLVDMRSGIEKIQIKYDPRGKWYDFSYAEKLFSNEDHNINSGRINEELLFINNYSQITFKSFSGTEAMFSNDTSI